MEGKRVKGDCGGTVGGRLWRVAIITASAAFGATSQSDAAIYYWQDSPRALVKPARTGPSSHHGGKKSDVVKESAKPHGPLIISISIARQKLRIYDANGLFAETPISTGMPGHPTPMGVFSIIQKQKFHRSNIYSDAPMPYMQRITWSGVAIHAGVLPGYPASHGCVRMPMAFAIKMWNWTRLGARVLVTPNDVTPAMFSHPLLATVKVLPQPVAAEETKADLGTVQNEKTADVKAKSLEPAADHTRIELRSTVGHTDDIKRATEANRPWGSSEHQTADASGALSLGVTGAAPAGKPLPQPTENAVSVGQAVAKSAAEAEASKKQAELNAAKRDEVAASGAIPASDRSADVQAVPAQADTPAPASTAPLKDDLKNDFTSTATSKLDPAAALKRSGQIAVFVSRKDSKLYVRQNFSPLFDMPVTIASDERALGTHVFTAQVDNRNANILHWSVVSLPFFAQSAYRRAEEERSSHRRRRGSASPIEAKPLPLPDGPAEALDRLSLPADVMARIYEVVSTGGSIIVSDQGIAAGETGEGTDFIVSLH